jgi:hypothetical protein
LTISGNGKFHQWKSPRNAGLDCRTGAQDKSDVSSLPGMVMVMMMMMIMMMMI